VFSKGDIPYLVEEHFKGGLIHKENLQILRSGDETLITLVDDYFHHAKKDRMLRVACFYEQEETNVGRILGKGLDKVSKTKRQ
jgi:hypothetical protein